MMSAKVSGPNLPTSSRWPGRLDLEAPQRVGRADEPEGAVVVERHARAVVEVDLHGVDPGDLVDGVRHRRLHADAEDVELEQPHRLDVVLVELAHREPQPARLDGRAVEQRRVGQHDPAGVQGDVPGQGVEPLDVLEEQVEALVPQPARAQLGQLGDGRARPAGPDVREGLGDRVDLGRGQAERRADVADGVAHAVGVHHRHAGDAVAAEALEDLLVDLGAASRLDVEVDVGQLGAQRGAEALHEQAVLERLDPGDAEQVVDQAAGARAARGHAHPHVAHQVADRGDGEEVRRVAEPVDDVELVVEPLLDLAQPARGRPGVAAGDAGPGPLAQHGARGLVRRRGRARWARAGAPSPARGHAAGRARSAGPAPGCRRAAGGPGGSPRGGHRPRSPRPRSRSGPSAAPPAR